MVTKSLFIPLQKQENIQITLYNNLTNSNIFLKFHTEHKAWDWVYGRTSRHDMHRENEK